MRTVKREVANKDLWDILNGIFQACPKIEKIETREYRGEAHIKLVLKRQS